MSQQAGPTSLTATYTSLENQPFQISSQLDLSSSHAPSSDLITPEEQTKQTWIQTLSQLRKAAATIQAGVNRELTQRMEEDKAREAAANKKKKGGVIDDEAEEQYYGEEVVEDSD